MSTAEPPTFLGMVLCDNILQDPETRKYFLMGTATVTFARSFPARYAKMCIYVVLTGIKQKTTVSVKLVRVDAEVMDDHEMMQISGDIDGSDPLAVAELAFSLRNLMFPQPGEYRFQVYAEDHLLGERKFIVRKQTDGRRRRET